MAGECGKDLNAVGPRLDVPVIFDGGGLHEPAISILEGVSNVTIEGLEIRNYASGGIVAQGAGISNLKIEHNYIHDISGSAISLENVGNSLVSKNKISNPGSGDSIAIAVTGKAYGGNSITMSGVTISDNQITDFRGKALYVAAEDSSVSIAVENITISGNTFNMSNPISSGSAIELVNVKGTSTFNNNNVTITGTMGSGSSAFDGICISGADTGSWTLSNNRLDGGNVCTSSAGIRLSGSLSSSAVLNITENTVTKWAFGIYSDTLSSGIQVRVDKNRIYDNTMGIINGNGASIDARCNFWGDASGPNHSTENADGSGNAVSNNVAFVPWYADYECASLTYGEFDNVINNNKQKGYFTIQAAIDDANPGDVLQVKPGTIYNECVIINKSITLIGDCGDEDTPGPGENPPILSGVHGQRLNGAAFKILSGVSDVTIKGFEITEYYDYTYGHGIVAEGIGNNNITIQYNKIHKIEREGVYSGYSSQHVLSGWQVTHNVLEWCGKSSAIHFKNVSNSSISNNTISNPKGLTPRAIDLLPQASGNDSISVSEVTISGNQITGYKNDCIWVRAWAVDASSSVTMTNINIVNNTISANCNLVLAWKASDTATLENLTVIGNSFTVKDPKGRVLLFI